MIRLFFFAFLYTGLLFYVTPTDAQVFMNGQDADLVIGQSGFNTNTLNVVNSNGMDNPMAATVDPTTGKLFVTDQYNNRVLRFTSINAAVSGSAAECALGQPDLNTTGNHQASANTFWSPAGIVLDGTGTLYVADYFNNRVLRFNNASTKPSGAAADGVLGQPDFTSHSGSTSQNSLHAPYSVAIDTLGNLFVADIENNRVMRFNNASGKANGADADGVLGQPGFTTATSATAQNGMNYPTAVSISRSGVLYVADQSNNRVLRFNNAAGLANGANADGVLGQPDFVSNGTALTASGMSNPAGAAADNAGNLFVSDYYNGRVLRFDAAAAKPNGANADGVLGWATFTATGSYDPPTQSGIAGPVQLCISPGGDLFVPSPYYNRITRFNAAAGKVNGANADVVLGKPDFGSGHINWLSAAVLNAPAGVAVDPITHKLFVADERNNRVLRFPSVASLTNGAPAEGVLGQSNFTSCHVATTQASIISPTSPAFDILGNLYVADAGNRRVLRYNSASSKADGSNADCVLGQVDFVSADYGISQTDMRGPIGVAVDTIGHLYVADEANNRILRFNNAASIGNHAPADGVLGQPDFTSDYQVTTQTGMHFPWGIALDDAGNLYVADTYNHRVLRFNSAAAKPNGAPADGVLGQPDFVSSAYATTRAGMYYPNSVTLDGSGNLFLSDQGNQRITRFDSAATKANGANADGVLGQTDFISGGLGTNINHLQTPEGLAIVRGSLTRLFVAEWGNSRVTRFSWSSLPIHIASITATLLPQQQVRLDWSTADEVNNLGFKIQRRTAGSGQFTTLPSSFVPGHGTTNVPHFYSFTDSMVAVGSYQYRLQQIDIDSTLHYTDPVSIDVVTSVVEAAVPYAFELKQNFPNPFNPTTQIRFSLPERVHATLSVYNILGQLVGVLVNGSRERGSYVVAFNASFLPSGVYLYRLNAGGFQETRRMIFLK